MTDLDLDAIKDRYEHGEGTAFDADALIAEVERLWRVQAPNNDCLHCGKVAEYEIAWSGHVLADVCLKCARHWETRLRPLPVEAALVARAALKEDA